MTRKHFKFCWLFVRWILGAPVDSPQQGSVARRSDVFSDICLNKKQTNKQCKCRWFDTPVCLYDVTMIRICNLVKYISRGHYYAWLTDTHRALSNPHCTRWCNYDVIGSTPLYYHNTEIFSVLLPSVRWILSPLVVSSQREQWRGDVFIDICLNKW